MIGFVSAFVAETGVVGSNPHVGAGVGAKREVEGAAAKPASPKKVVRVLREVRPECTKRERAEGLEWVLQH